MHDYDTEYRRLRAAGLEGWAGSQHERNRAHGAPVIYCKTAGRIER